jgi:hypothetical protein
MAFNNSYKKWHKPNTSENAKTKQGYYKVQNKDKYVGDPNLVVYRSSWEMAFCKWCDYSPSVIRWSSEPIKIPYYDRVSKLEECKKLGLDPNNPRNWVVKNYNTDFWVEVDKGENVVEKWFVEVKPKHKLIKPTPPPKGAKLKDIKSFNARAKEYLINEAKFAALKEWASRHNTKFYIFTEDTLSKIIGRFWNEK